MMQVKILSFKSAVIPAIAELEADFQKRLKRFVKLEISELNSAKFNKLPLPELLKTEAEMLLATIAPSDYLIVLAEKGKEFSSQEFATWIDLQATKGFSKLTFVLGSPNGVAPVLYERANLILSLSKMTFTAQFARLLLLEQIYRAISINKNLPYHKTGI